MSGFENDSSPASGVIAETAPAEADFAHERTMLIETIRSLTHEAMINRDIEFGLRAEVHRLEDQLMAAHYATEDTIAEIRRSRTWRTGRAVLLPITLVKGSRGGRAR